MAKLLAKPYPGDFSFHRGEEYETFRKREEELEAAIPWDRVMKFPVADGYACYLVVKENPLTLQHIPVGDAWRIPDAHIRGLKLADWERQKNFNRFWREAGKGGNRP